MTYMIEENMCYNCLRKKDEDPCECNCIWEEDVQDFECGSLKGEVKRGIACEQCDCRYDEEIK